MHAALVALLHIMLDRRHDAEVSIAVEPSSVPASRLVTWAPEAGADANAAGLRLGQTAWLQSTVGSGPHTLHFTVRAHDTAVPA